MWNMIHFTNHERIKLSQGKFFKKLALKELFILQVVRNITQNKMTF